MKRVFSTEDWSGFLGSYYRGFSVRDILQELMKCNSLGNFDLVLEQKPPCSHKGCYHHVKHPCEECGRLHGGLPIESLERGR